MTQGFEAAVGPPVASACVITEPYLLISHIANFRRDDGSRATDGLWHKDLLEHLRYIRDFTLAAPLDTRPPRDQVLPLPPPGEPVAGGGEVRYLDLKRARSLPGGLLALPGEAARLWKAIGRADVVHIGVIGWPIPLGWVAAPMARLRRKVLVVVIESSDWRVNPENSRRAGRLRRWRWAIREFVTERMARWCVRMADVPIFTQPQYRDSLLGPGSARGYVQAASWIDHRVVLSDARAEQAWADRAATFGQGPALVYVGRLTPQKGVLVLLEAMKRLDEQGVAASLDIFGSGELEEACRQAGAALRGPCSISLRGTLPYDDSFFEALRPYHALLVPSVSDEQPRIIYDAFSQALPVLGSDTHGLRSCVSDGTNGRLTTPGDPAALAEIIARVAADPEQLRALGLAALESARGYTHRTMHATRARILRERLDARRKDRHD